jgi:transcription elongation factor Elf1
MEEVALAEADRGDMSKEAMREEAERLIKEAMEKKSITVKQGDTRIEATCGKCGAKNRVSATPGQTRVQFACKECGQKQSTL